MHKTIIIISVALAAMSAACSGSGAHNSPGADSTAGDSTAAKAAREPLHPLPDTVYPSARALNYTIDIVDKSIDPQLSTLADLYADAPGIFTFRGGPHRTADYHGTVKGTPSDFNVDWTYITPEDYRETSLGSWGGGTGWTGQPLYVCWPDSCVKRFRSTPEAKLTADFGPREIMVGSLASQVLFINYDNGKASRQPIASGNPIKGTMSLDPTLNGNLYFGQGVPNERPFGARVIDLYRHEVTHSYNEDPKARRHWGAYDSSPLRVGQFLFRPGENGIIYKFLIGQGTLTLQSTLNYSVRGASPGIESSMAVYLNYGYTCDNHGNVICFNLESMKPVWHYSLGDDIDATPVLLVENGRPYIYVGCEIDLQDTGHSSFVKIDAIDGHAVWEKQLDGRRYPLGKKHFDGGYYATALPGTGNCSKLLFTNVVLNTDGQNGSFIAFDRESGKVVYTTLLRYYAWSSPVGFVNEQGRMFVVTGDCTGNLYLIDGINGNIITRKHIGNNFESSPAVIGNTLVVGSRGREIYRISLK